MKMVTGSATFDEMVKKAVELGSPDPCSGLNWVLGGFESGGSATFDEMVKKAVELGSPDPCSGGINWVWAKDFPTADAAGAFNTFCEENGYETRGVYTTGTTFAVRYR